MKTITFLTVLTFVFSISCLGRDKYTIPKAEFIKQFTGRTPSNRIYCFDESGNKVWLGYNNNSQLIITLRDNKEKLLMLHTVKYDNEVIEAIEYNVWMPGKKVISFAIEDVTSFRIERKFGEYELPYFNSDSSKNVARLKNDSLKKEYSGGNEWIINLVNKEKPFGDTLSIITNACYNINFRDGNQVTNGVVYQITHDSIYISSSFNKEMAAGINKEYTVYRYLISDIAGLSLLKSGGFGVKKIIVEDYNMIINEVAKATLCCPYWYAVNPSTGAVKFYRSLATEKGFKGITETNGRAIWYEGE